jgi:phage shock protein A
MVSAELITSVLERIKSLEDWRSQRDIADARAEEQRKHLDARFDALQKQIGDLNDTLRWVNRLIIGSILTGIIAFLISGGFKL